MSTIYYFLFIFIGLAPIFGCQGGGGSGSDGQGPLPEPSTGWQATLKVSVQDATADGGVAYNRLVAGERETATDAFDNASDIRAFLAGPVQAYFVHTGDTGYDQNSEQLWQDLRAVNRPEEWKIEVMAESGRTVTLSWTLPTGEVSCATNQFSLMDSDGQLGQTNLCTTESLTYVGDGQLRHFVLKVS